MAKLELVIAISIFAIVPLSTRSQGRSTVAVASPDEVCSYLAGKMTSAVPQVPTLCSAKRVDSKLYSISIFSPRETLEGDMRRAWSISLFQSLQTIATKNPLHGVCTTSVVCDLRVSDAYTSTHHWYYALTLDKRLRTETYFARGSTPGELASPMLLDGDPSSDDWYLGWWSELAANGENPGTANSAEAVGKDACAAFLQALPKYMDGPLPSCSVMLASEDKLYLAVDFSRELDAMLGSVPASLFSSIGKALENYPYGGEVIFRSPWVRANDGANWRVFRTYDLRYIEFLWQEVRAGQRTETAALAPLLFYGHSGNGQVSETDLFAGQSNDLIARIASVAKLRFASP